MNDLDILKAGIMAAILLLAIIRPKSVWPYVLRAGVVLLVVFSGIYLFALVMGVQP